MGGELSNNYSPDQFRDENGRFGVSEAGHKLIESYGGYAEGKHERMADVLKVVGATNTPAEARAAGKKELARLEALEPTKPHDGLIDHIVKSVQALQKQGNSPQRSAADARADQVLRIRDSTGRARGRTMNQEELAEAEENESLARRNAISEYYRQHGVAAVIEYTCPELNPDGSMKESADGDK